MTLAVVVTRPHEHAGPLLQAIAEIWPGGQAQVRHHPLIDLVRFADDDSAQALAARQRTLALDEYQAVIAISQNAAECGLHWMEDYWPQPPVGIRWYGVGPTTAEVLRFAGLECQTPVDRFDSEGVLALPSLQDISDEKILIWRGVGGRETLAAGLRARGARVDYAELYERRQIDWSPAQWADTLAGSPLLILSSGQALDIALSQVADLAQRIRGVIVPSERVATYARGLGFSDVMVAASARNEDTLHSLRAWLAAS